jgi:hypothetical protein
MAGYSGTWRSRAYRPPSLQGDVPNVNHLQPEKEDTPPNWAQSPATIPAETGIMETREIYSVDAAPGGPTYDPPSHSEGVGFGAGLSWAASQAQNDSAHMTDDGSIAARLPNPMGERDGTYHAERSQLLLEPAGLAPAGTPDLPPAAGMWQGLNAAEYPNRMTGHRRWSWRDRVYERRTWSVEFPAVTTPNAYTAPDSSPVADGNAYTSPYAAAQSTQVRVVNTTAPQLRRTPGAWDQSITSDGTEYVPYQEPAFQSWGL